MTKVARITVSIEEPLLAQFETYIDQNGYPTRSEAIKGLMRGALIEKEWLKGADVAGTISLVYDHHKRGTMEKLTDAQHDFGHLIICTQHVHLDHHNCMEVLVLRGRAIDIRRLETNLKAIKGIKHCALMMATTGQGIE